jgi:hypothetical protein
MFWIMSAEAWLPGWSSPPAPAVAGGASGAMAGPLRLRRSRAAASCRAKGCGVLRVSWLALAVSSTPSGSAGRGDGAGGSGRAHTELRRKPGSKGRVACV